MARASGAPSAGQGTSAGRRATDPDPSIPASIDRCRSSAVGCSRRWCSSPRPVRPRRRPSRRQRPSPRRDRASDRRRPGRARRDRRPEHRRSMWPMPATGAGGIFVVEQAGRIRIVRDGTLVERPFLDITGRIASGGERGLLGHRLPPRLPDRPAVLRRLHRHATATRSSRRSGSVRRRPGRRPIRTARSSSSTSTSPSPTTTAARIAFGPDGMLYIALGDGGSGGDPQGNGQRLDTLLAKILRIDVDGAPGGERLRDPAPTTRSSATAGAKPEIWLTGLRNPWRIQLRPPDRRPVDRRRRPGRLGGDRRRPAPAPAAWTSAGTSWRASTASSRATAATRRV